jgi:hypothetical protein
LTRGINMVTLSPISIGRKIWLVLDIILSACFDKLLPLAIHSLCMWFDLVQRSHVLFICLFTIHRYRNIIWIVIIYRVNITICIIGCIQGSPHIVKTGRLDFSFSWLQDEVRENLGDFRKSIQILTFLSLLPNVPLPFTKRTCCTMILKRMQLTSLEWNIEHQTLFGSNFRNMGAPFMWILKKKYDYWWKKYGLEKTDRATKISLFDRNWAISLKPRLVWWALGALSECLSFKCGCSSSSFYWTIKVIKTLVEFVCKCSFFWIVLCHYVQLCTSWQANCVSLTNTYFRSFPRSWLINGFVTRLTRWVLLMEQELLTLPEHLSSPPVFSGVRVTWSLVLFVCFVDRCLSFCTFSFGHCVVCSSIYGFWLPPFGIFKLLIIY